MFEKSVQPQITIIGEGVTIEGDFTGQGNLELYGEIRGNITLSGHIKVGPHAKVTANVACGQALIAGRIKGRITAKEDIEIQSSADITGDITAKQITISKGAAINGKVHISTKNDLVSVAEKIVENNKKK